MSHFGIIPSTSGCECLAWYDATGLGLFHDQSCTAGCLQSLSKALHLYVADDTFDLIQQQRLVETSC